MRDGSPIWGHLLAYGPLELKLTKQALRFYRLLVLERVLGVDHPLDPSGVRSDVLSDVDMLATTGGRERTEQEYRVLLSAGGFVLSRLTPIPVSIADILETTPDDAT